MLYEKMLTRKVIGLQKQRPEAESESVTDSTIEDTQKAEPEPDQEKQSASMGKVLNLMRQVTQIFVGIKTLTFMSETMFMKWRKGTNSFQGLPWSQV